MLKSILSVLLLSGTAAMAMVGPMQLTNLYSGQYGYVGMWSWANWINSHNTFRFFLGLGPREFHIGGTWAHRFNASSRLKITLAHMAQNYNFVFANSDKHDWIGQSSVGLQYQYLFTRNILSGVHVGGYFMTASNKSYAIDTLPGGGSNLRHVAGADNYDLHTGLDIQPWKTGSFALDMHYDDVDYDTRYSAAENSHGLGASFSWRQSIAKNWAFNLGAAALAPYRYYHANFSWQVPTCPDRHLVLSLIGSYIEGDIPKPHDARIGLNIAYRWGGDSQLPVKHRYGWKPTLGLLDWGLQDAVQSPQVYAIADGKVE